MPSQSRIAIPRRNQLSIVAFRRTNPPIRPHRLDSIFNRLDPEIQREGKTCQINGQISHPGARSKPAKKMTPPQETSKSCLRPADKPLNRPTAPTSRNRTRIPPHSPKLPPTRINSPLAGRSPLHGRYLPRRRNSRSSNGLQHSQSGGHARKRSPSRRLRRDEARLRPHGSRRGRHFSRRSAPRRRHTPVRNQFLRVRPVGTLRRILDRQSRREFAYTVRTRAHHRSVSGTHQTQPRRNRPRKSNLRDVANHEATGSPAHRRSRRNLLEAVSRRNLRRVATRPALPGRRRQTVLTQGSRRLDPEVSPVGARHAVPERPNSTHVPPAKPTPTRRFCKHTNTLCGLANPIRQANQGVRTSRSRSAPN